MRDNTQHHFVSKINVPMASPSEVLRTDICDQIFAAGAARLVLLRAPAGFGKTTVMLQVRQRFEQAGVPTAWLTLDSADNDIGRFLGALAAALDGLIPGLSSMDARSGWEGPDGMAFSLIDRVAAHPVPFTLFLDDFEAVQNQAVLGLVNELIDQLPRGVQLVVGSRGVPDLSLGWLRARGWLLEIEPAQLRFTIAEADSFLRDRRHLDLEAEDVERLHRSTEGWAAALWLASVSLENRKSPKTFIAGFSGSNAAVVEYLVEDVLTRQTEPVRHFLLRTSILAQLNPALCDVICGRTNSAELLGALERANLFLIPIQGESNSYRYHSMFAEFLRVQLDRLYPGELPMLHRAAAQWFVEQDRPVPAIGHALATGDMQYALPLLNANALQLLEQGRVRLLTRWLDPLQQRGDLKTQPMLEVIHAWAVCFARGPREAVVLLDGIEATPQSDAEVMAHRLAMRPLLLALMDRIDEAGPLAAEALSHFPPSAAFARGFLEITLANLTMIGGRYHDALRLVDAARSRQGGVSSSFNVALSEAVEGAVDLTQGRLKQALARLRLAVSTGNMDASRATNGNAMAGVLLAEALYEADHCEQAERLLAVYVPLIRSVGIPDQLISAHIVLARIVLDRGEADRALQLLAELERIGHRESLSRVVASARLERSRVLLMQGSTTAARFELDRCGDKELWGRVALLSLRANDVETLDVAQARWAVLAGSPAEAVISMRVALAQADRSGRERRVLTLKILMAQALYCDEQRKKGMRLMAQALQFAAGEGYIRAFLNEGSVVLGMLRELRTTPTLLTEGGTGEGTIAFLDKVLRHPTRSDAVPATQLPATGTHLASELLTRKEIQVLRLVADGLSNDQMADRLFVAETTVRTHLRNIHAKLGVRSRTEAVAVARRAGLFD